MAPRTGWRSMINFLVVSFSRCSFASRGVSWGGCGTCCGCPLHTSLGRYSRHVPLVGGPKKDARHAGETTSLGRPRSASESSQKSWRKCLGGVREVCASLLRVLPPRPSRWRRDKTRWDKRSVATYSFGFQCRADCVRFVSFPSHWLWQPWFGLTLPSHRTSFWWAVMLCDSLGMSEGTRMSYNSFIFFLFFKKANSTLS